MTESAFIDLLQNALWLIILLSAPMLLVNLMVGVSISIFQAVTQIQEASLSFVPKLLASFLILILAGPWMTQMVLDYSNRIFDTLIEVAKAPKK
jgi:flagellar biosynthetic protein FliQ